MARILDEKEAKKLQEESAKAIEKKVASQEKQGKAFDVDPEGHHSGVIPEAVWKNLPGKKLDDPEAIA